jgi:hypothetical protein
MVVEQGGTLHAVKGTFVTFLVSENIGISLFNEGRRSMTLFDATAQQPGHSFRSRKMLAGVFALCGVAAIAVSLCWNAAAEHRVNRFFSAVEANDFPVAFAIWNNDPDWRQHTRDVSAGYSYGRFLLDWGTAGEYGRIASHKILHSTSSYGNNTLVAVEINGRASVPLVVAVARSTHSMSFPPFNLTQMKNVFGWAYWQLSYR